MKDLISKLSMLFAALSLAFVACDKDPVEEPQPEPGPQPKPEVELTITSDAQERVPFEGGEVVITYTLSGESDTLPEASCEADWVSNIEVASGTITLSVAENESYEERSARVKILFNDKEHGVEIIQDPEPQPVPPVDETETYNYTMATAERDTKFADPEFSIVFTSEDGKTKLIAHLVEAVGNWMLEGSEYSSARGTIDLSKTMFKNESGIVKLSDAAAEVSYVGTDDIPPSSRCYTFTFTLTDNDGNTHILTYEGAVANLYQGPTGPEEFAPAKVVAVKSMIGNFFLQLYIDSTRYHELDLLDEIAPNDKYLSEGTYKYSDNNIGHTNSKFNIEGDQSCPLEDAELTLSHTEEGVSTISGFIKSVAGHHITFEWSGVVEGFDFTKEEPEEPVDPEEPSIKVEVSAAKVNYDRAGEKQILFTAGDQSHQFNFKHSEIVVSKPIPDGTYSTAEGTMTERYCKHDIDFAYGDMTKVTVKITNNSDSTTRFVARWTFEGEAYSFDWTGAVEGYTYEDVSGQRLDFTPTHVEVSDAGFAGLYFYFYDARENELVLNYDRNKVYMPYINYEGTKLDIDSTDYTFEFSDNGDGTYTYNARFVTLDGRIIEFEGTLPTSVS